MTRDAILARLEATGLRLPESDMPAFMALVADMESAAAVARAPLSYSDEPSNVFRLSPAAAPPPG
jgi:hypothetical protein